MDVARVAGVETEAVTIQSVASARRRLRPVIVDYKIEADDFAAAEKASEAPGYLDHRSRDRILGGGHWQGRSS